MIKNFFNNKNIFFFLLIILLLIFIRIIILPVSPPGFYIDEIASQSHIVAMVKNKTNANGQFWPFYSRSLGGGFTTPTYLYSASFWSLIFGTSKFTIRLFSQFITIISIFFIGLSLKNFFDKKTALIGIIIGLTLPWGWLQGSLAWDPVLVPFMASLVFLGWSISSNSKKNGQIIFGEVLMLVGTVLLMYTYPPYWISAPILACVLFFSLYIKKIISFKNIIVFLILAILFILPLISFVFQPGSLSRSLELSVFSYGSVIEGFLAFLINILKLINPIFLFFIGDQNLRHATVYQGMLGFGSVVPIVFVIINVFKWIKKKERLLITQKEIYVLVISAVGYIACLIGSALTIEGQPHSLRSCAVWVFAVIIITVGWKLIIEYKKRWLIFVAVVILIISTFVYVIDLAFFYPKRATEYFSLLIDKNYTRQINLL